MNTPPIHRSWRTGAFALAATLAVAGPLMAPGAQPPPTAPAAPAAPTAPAPTRPLGPEDSVVYMKNVDGGLEDLALRLEELSASLLVGDNPARQEVREALERVRARVDQLSVESGVVEFRASAGGEIDRMARVVQPAPGARMGFDEENMRLIVEDALRSQRSAIDGLGSYAVTLKRGQKGFEVEAIPSAPQPEGWFDNEQLAEMQSLEIFNQVYGGTLDMMRKTRTLASDAEMSAIFSIHRVEDIADSEDEALAILSRMLETATSPTVRRALKLKIAELRVNVGDEQGALEIYKELIQEASDQPRAVGVAWAPRPDGALARVATRLNNGETSTYSVTTTTGPEGEEVPEPPAPPAPPMRVIRRR